MSNETHDKGDRPNETAIAQAGRVLDLLRNYGIRPDKTLDSPDGGVVLSFVSGKSYCNVECLNSGEVLAAFRVLPDGLPVVWEVLGAGSADGTACTPSSVAPCIRTRDLFESRFIPTAAGFTAYVFGCEKLPGGAHRRHFTLVVGDDGWSLTMVDKLTGDVRAIDLDERGVDMKAVFKGAAAFLRGPEPDDAKGAW